MGLALRPFDRIVFGAKGPEKIVARLGLTVRVAHQRGWLSRYRKLFSSH